MAEAVGFEPTCPCGQPHFEFGTTANLYAHLEVDASKQMAASRLSSSLQIADVYCEHTAPVLEPVREQLALPAPQVKRPQVYAPDKFDLSPVNEQDKGGA